VEELGDSGALARAAEVLYELRAAFEAVQPAIRRFCSGK
jgi:hypothetical protein